MVCVLVCKSWQLGVEKKKRKHCWTKMCVVCFQLWVFSVSVVGCPVKTKKKRREVERAAVFPPLRKKKTHTHNVSTQETHPYGRVCTFEGVTGVWGCGRGGVLVPRAGTCI